MAPKHSPPSRKLYEAVKLGDKRQYELAHELDMNPAILSQIINGQLLLRRGDSRLEKLGEMFGLSPAECWEQEAE